MGKKRKHNITYIFTEGNKKETLDKILTELAIKNLQKEILHISQ